MDLPQGLTRRPLGLADARAVFELIAAQELADTGEVAIEEADIVADWSRPSHDPATTTTGVHDGDRLVAYADIGVWERGDAAVHPDHRGRGLGTALARWMQDAARARGRAAIGMPVPEGSPGDRLLGALGYHVRWRSWVLRLPPGATVPARPLPEGYAVRAAAADEHVACWQVQEDAFLEWSRREREGYDDWHAEVVDRPGFEPWNLRVVTGPGGEVVAMALVQLAPASRCAYIARLATRRDQRGRGLAQALLVDAFGAAAERGATRSELSTDSRTGALGLYEKVGMQVAATWVHRGIDLTAAVPA